MRIQRTLLISFICLVAGVSSGCANRSPYNPYPPAYPQQYQGYPYTGQPVMPIQPSPYTGQPLPGGVQPGYPNPQTGYSPQPQVYPQQAPGFYPQQGPAPLIGR